MLRKLLIILIAPLLLSSCAGRYGHMHTTMAGCGWPSAAYSQFHDCMKETIKAPSTKQTQDYYARTTTEFLEVMETHRTKVKKNQLSSKKAMQAIGTFVDEQVAAEQKSNQQAAAIMGIMLVGAAAVSCANTNCYGGNQSYANSYQGCCSWHGGVNYGVCAPNGNIMCNDGQPSPSCAC